LVTIAATAGSFGDTCDGMAMGGDVELMTRMYREWSRGDMSGLFEVFDPAVEVRPALGAFLATTVYHGYEGVRSWYEDTNEPWSRLDAEPERFIDAGERTVVVVALHARVPGGHVDVDATIAHVVTVRAGKIVRIDGYAEPDAALAAVAA
jgi:ketosteroid isomerase-like protein